MPKQGQRAEVNTFIQGLITEASPLNFPPNASKQEENFELFRDGTRRRRLGMDLEDGGNLYNTSDYGTINPNFPGVNTFVWKAVSGKTDLNFLVVQVGRQIEFYNLNNTPLSSVVLGNLTIPSYIDINYQMASIEGKLIIASGSNLITIIEYDVATTAFTSSSVTLKTRDLWGVATGNSFIENDIYYRPDSMIVNHLYNLCNQSWGVARKHSSGSLSDPTAIYFGEYSKWPSNSEVVWTGLQYQPVSSTETPFERIYPSMYSDVFGLAPIAAKGYFIIDALDRGASRLAAWQAAYSRSGNVISSPTFFTPPQDKTPDGATLVCSYAGRVFYSGFSGDVINGDERSPSLNNYIFYSQLVKNTQDISKCYQAGDPTSRDGSDLVDTDGGFIRIQGASKILAMTVAGKELVVFADNGVWAIDGGSDYGFSATNIKVTLVSNYGCISGTSVITEGDSICYWGINGINMVSRDIYGMLVVQSLTNTTIQDLYDSISFESRMSVFGVFDELSKKMRWIFKEGDIFSSTSVTKELTYDLTISAFSLNTIKNISDNSIELIAPFYFLGTLKYLVFKYTGDSFNKYGFAEYWNKDFIDWKSVDGIGADAKAFMLTGSQIAGDSAVHKQTPYIVMHFERTETVTDVDAVPQNQSSCLFKFYWDWADNDLSNKVTQVQQGYRYRKALFATPSSPYDNGFEVVSTKSKLRGRGRSFALYLETEPKKDCHILGWNLTINGDALA